MGKKGDKLGTNWGMSQIISIATAVFFVFPHFFIFPALAYVRLDETGGTNFCTLKMAPNWRVFHIFPEKSLICSRANAPISLVWYKNCEKHR